VKPPTLHIKAPNSYYNESTSPFLFNTEAGVWMDDKRLAGVSAFGFGGTNFHAVIENEGNQPVENAALQTWPAELFVFRGDTQATMKQLLQSVRSILENNDNISLKDIAYSLLLKNDQPILLSIVASGREDLMLKIELALSGATAKEIFATQPLEGKVAFLFPGQGSQRINMARELFVAFPAMRKLLKNNPAYEKILFPNAVFSDDAAKKQKERIKDTRVAQPLLGIVDLAIANFLKDLGIQPDMVAGHSYGELPALCFANVFAEEELVSLSEKRAKAILDAIEDDKGVMIAVNCSKEELATYAKEGSGVYPVNHNSPQQWVLAGATKDMERLMEQLKQSKVSYKQLEVACAFHSPLLSKSKGLYKTVIKDVAFSAPSVPVWSNTTTALYPKAAKDIKELLTDHLINPVRFTEEVQQMYDAGARVFIEVGPGKVLAGLTKAIIGKDELILHTEDKNAITHLLSTIGKYVASGRKVNLEKLFDGRAAQLLQLDAPEQYKKSSTVWYVNGQLSVPSVGKLPAHGALPIVQPLKLKGTEVRTVVTANGNAEHMVQEYLNSVKYLVQAQRDVILGYLGHTPPAFSQPIMTQEIKVAAPAPQQETIHVHIKRDPKKILIEVVSDKTGYPHEMLGMDMDMEADLSIDSIKRMEIIGELRTQLGGFKTAGKSDETVVEQLATIKTLSGLLQWIAENVDQQIPDSGGISLQHAVQQAPPAKGWSEQDIRSTILLTVSEKTGYPQDMLGLDLDLEADLSIDSIKRMEILGELKIKIGGFNQGEDKTEALAAIKTLNGLVSWISSNMPSEIVATVVEQPIAAAPAAKEVLSRIRFALTPSLFENIVPEKLKGEKFAITDDGSKVALSIKKLLEQQGASVNIITASDPLEGYSGLIILDILATTHRQDILTAFSTIKKLDAKGVKWVYAISGIDTTHLRNLQGYPGFLKSLDIEWEQTKCRSISLTDVLSPEEIATITLDEIQHPDRPSEIIYQDGIRHIFQLIPSSTPTGDTPNIKLDKNSVILVLGGAQGITSELMIRFSKEYPCNYVLVGRSADPRKEGSNKYAAFSSKEDIKKQLIAEGQLSKPAEIEKKASDIHKSNQILHTITSLEASGATVDYHTLDLRNEQELSLLISSVYKDYGRIDGVIHGAGLLEDKLFQQKTSDSFERVFSTKVTPLRILAEQLRPDVQFVILFSSVASVYGNRGQTDYAAANSVMDRYAWELKKTLKGKVTAINWGPWKGTGMVSPTLEKEYERRGIPLIPLKAGMEVFVNELKYGNESQVLIMAE
jgi:malonyl CoA-acyl carrier protein transacylase/NAD(P)-dependent dehydrogenase (short-subunit alcohol dehydrogenase family)